MEQTSRSMFAVSLWSIRRLPTKFLQLYGLKQLLEALPCNEVEYVIVKEFIKELEETGSF